MSDDIGGEWTAEWRHLHVDSSGWLDGRDVKLAMGTVRECAAIADRTRTKSNLWTLQMAAQRLERESERYIHRLTKLHEQIGYLVAAVVQARALHVVDEQTPEEAERERTEELLAASELGLDRVAAFYGVNGKARR